MWLRCLHRRALLREYSQTLSETTRSILKTFGIDDYALKLETAEDDWCEGREYLPHVHVIADTPLRGRNCVPASKWADAWLSTLPQSMHPTQGVDVWLDALPSSMRVHQDGVHVGDVNSAAAVCTYVAKSPFRSIADSAHAAVSRVLSGISATKGMQKFNLRGRYAS